MNIKLNGEDYRTQVKTVSELLRELGIIPERVAIEVNLEIIKKDKYVETDIHDGDQVEVVSFVGGGSVSKI